MAICQQMFEYGLQAHRERQDELTLFRDAVDAAKLDNRQQAAVKIDEFMVYKHKVSPRNAYRIKIPRSV